VDAISPGFLFSTVNTLICLIQWNMLLTDIQRICIIQRNVILTYVQRMSYIIQRICLIQWNIILTDVQRMSYAIKYDVHKCSEYAL